MQNNEKKEFISEVVDCFYELAIKDVFIGHHFRKIQEGQSNSPIAPTLENFKEHLPRIKEFWNFVLLGEACQIKFNLLLSHEYLKIRKGELGRWVLLFKQELKKRETPQTETFCHLWNQKIDHFRQIFEKNYF